MTIHFIVLFLLLLLSALFSSTETAFTSLSIVQIQHLAQKRGKRGRLVKSLSKNPNILLTTILIGNNLVNIGASAIATSITIELFGSRAIGYMTGILTLVVLIFAEVTPKQIAIIRNEPIALMMAYPIRIISIVLFPVIKGIGSVSSFLAGLIGGEKKSHITLESIIHMMHLAERMGVVENYETGMVKSVFRFNDVPVQAIMTHRTDVFSLENTLTLNEALPHIIREGYSRIPVYSDGDPEQINGILLLKQALKHLAEEHGEKKLDEIIEHPLFVSGKRKVNELYFLFKKEKLNIAVVLDEYGGLGGIVTLEDVVEELFGELFDENEKTGWEKITPLEGNSFRIMGDTTFYQITDRFGIELPHGRHVQTIGGYIVEQFGFIPVKNQVLETPFGTFQTESVKKNRVESVIFNRKTKAPLD